MRFGIMAPAAAQWAAFEEYGGPYPRAIFKREALNIEDIRLRLSS
jgi:hypothetical protein